MKITGIRKLPQYMAKRIERLDRQDYPEQDGNNRFYAYLTKQRGDLVMYTVAVRNYRQKWYCKQVTARRLHSNRVFVKDMCFTNIAGYKVGWYAEHITKYQRWYEDGEWGWTEDKYFNIHATLINPEVLTQFPEYRYSLAEKFNAHDLFKYLRIYEQYPIAEMLMKLNLQYFATSVTLLRLLAKDKQFRKWLYLHHEEIKPHYYIPAIVKAYRQNKSVELVYDRIRLDKEYRSDYNRSIIKQVIDKDEAPKLFNYLEKQKTNLSSYQDYLIACRYLELNLNLAKHRYPHNFKLWHNIRIDQYHTKQIEDDERERQELYQRFAQVASKYLSLERLLVKDSYICLIAKSPRELIYEGEQLNHCVGRMNYDQKFAREETLIFFVRDKTAPDTPLVTLEYSLSNHKVLQCYGNHDSKPTDEILHFVNKVWLPYANRKIKAIT